MDKTLTAKRLRDVILYDRRTGIFTWKEWRKGVRRGNVAGCLNKNRVVIWVDERLYRAHRLAWLYVYGHWPKHHIDHIDGNSANNRIANLRDVSRSVNQQNRKRAAAHNKCGLLGVFARGRRWVAEVRLNRKAHYLGRFDSKEEAHRAYLKAKRHLHPGCTI